jgi:hypothetical protein
MRTLFSGGPARTTPDKTKLTERAANRFAGSRAKKFLSYYRPYRGLLLADLLSAVVISAAALLLPVCTNFITKNLLATKGAPGALDSIYELGVAMLALVALQGLCTLFVDYQGHVMGAKMRGSYGFPRRHSYGWSVYCHARSPQSGHESSEAGLGRRRRSRHSKMPLANVIVWHYTTGVDAHRLLRSPTFGGIMRFAIRLIAIVAAALVLPIEAYSDSSFVGSFTTIETVGPTVPANGDINPYGIVVVPSSTGKLVVGDILVSNFNASSNKQGTGTTIVQISPGGRIPYSRKFQATPRVRAVSA